MIETEIKSIIEKNLPAQIGDVLKKTLEQAEKDAIKVKQLEEHIINKNLNISKLENKISKYEKFNERNLALKGKEKFIIEKERSLKIELLEFKLDIEKEKTDFTKLIALGLVKNLEYRRTLFNNTNEPYKDQFNNIQCHNKSQNLQETKTVE